MSQVFKNRTCIEDGWTPLRLAEGEDPATLPLPDGDILFPLAVWQTRKNEIISRYKRIGLWLAPNEGPETLAEDLHYFIVIGVDFPKFADGRGFSVARLLRERFHYEGELRAIGQPILDQVFFLTRCGFDTIAFAEPVKAEDVLRQYAVFPEVYQTAADQPQPLFRRQEGSA